MKEGKEIPMSTDRPIPHGEIVDYSHIEDGETRLEIANYVAPPIYSVEQLMQQKKDREGARR
jgi:hypothetical protein